MSSALMRSAVEARSRGEEPDSALDPAPVAAALQTGTSEHGKLDQPAGTLDPSEHGKLDPVATGAVEQARDTEGRFASGRVIVERPDGSTAVMRPQPHGGALLTGGKVGGGKYADEVRRYSRAELLDMLPTLIGKAKAGKLRDRDHIKLAELLTRISVPQQSEALDLEEGRRRLQLVVGSMIDSALHYGVPKDVVDGWYRRAVEEMEADA